MKNFLIMAVLFTGGLLAVPGSAQSLFLAPGITSESTLTANVGYGRDWPQRWFESGTGHLGGYWHAGYTWWESGRFGSAAHSVSVSPVFVYTFNAAGPRPFIEAGIGAAAFSRTEVGDRRMGSRLHFEDRFGAGLEFDGGHRLMLRVIHYSNAGLASPNQGINSWSLVYARRL